MQLACQSGTDLVLELSEPGLLAWVGLARESRVRELWLSVWFLNHGRNGVSKTGRECGDSATWRVEEREPLLFYQRIKKRPSTWMAVKFQFFVTLFSE